MSTPFGMAIALDADVDLLPAYDAGTYDADAQQWTARPEASAGWPWCTTFGIGPIRYERSIHDMGPPICG